MRSRLPLQTCIATALITAILAPWTTPADTPGPRGMAARLIEHYHMQRIPAEGPWFSLTYTSADAFQGSALPARYAGRPHAAGSAIVVIETTADFSALHRLQTDEVWHFYGGSPLDMLLLYPDGHGQTITLGPDVLAGQWPQLTVPRGVWQGSAPHDRSRGAYSFVGDQLSPGFEYADFEMGYRDALERAYPAYAKAVERFTRAEFATRPPEAPATAARTAAPIPVAFSSADVPVVTTAPGVELQELVGRVARDARTPTLSVAQFTLAPGRSSGSSFNHVAEEVFFVTSGAGQVHLGDRVQAVGPGSTVFIPAGEAHSIEANSAHTLVFLAISAPAYSQEDYVPIPPRGPLPQPSPVKP